MATNLTTIEVRLQANAKNFQNQINKGSQSVEKLRKSTQKVIPTQKTFQERLRNVSGSIAAVQGPLGPVAGRLNAIGAIVGMTFITLSLFASSINSDVFYAWLTQDLLPKVKSGAVIVMDNATFHKRSDMLEAITNAGCIPEFLPPYSPDLNPIEKKWACLLYTSPSPRD